MGTVHLVFGPQGAGKSTYSRQLAGDAQAVRFSIDDWMSCLFGADISGALDFNWVMERVRRCEKMVWATAADIANQGGNVVLDLGFMKVQTRSAFLEFAKRQGFPVQMHMVNAPADVRRDRVMARNTAKGETFSFEVTPAMFDMMEGEFESPTAAEISGSNILTT